MDEVIKKQILAVRATGEANMFDMCAVRRIAYRKGYFELVTYLEEHHGKYVNFILRGDAG